MIVLLDGDCYGQVCLVKVWAGLTRVMSLSLVSYVKSYKLLKTSAYG